MTAMMAEPPFVPKDQGNPDLWWPYGPAVGRYTIRRPPRNTEGR